MGIARGVDDVLFGLPVVLIILLQPYRKRELQSVVMAGLSVGSSRLRRRGTGLPRRFQLGSFQIKSS